MLNIFSVFIGGGLGSVLRYLVNISFGKTHLYNNCALPLATLSVNVFGSFIIGFLYAIFIQKTHLPLNIRLAITVGFCGGLTTFSTFSVEAYDLFKNGQILAASGYIALSVIVCILAVGLGIYLGTILGESFGK